MLKIKSITLTNAEPFLLGDRSSVVRGGSFLLSVYEKVHWENTDPLQLFLGFYLGALIRNLISLA